MITAQELRVGNWVNHKAEWSAESPKCVAHHFEWTDWHFYCIHESTISYEVIDPIPLTPEILDKCGFVKSDSHTHEARGLWSIQVANNTSLYFDETNPDDKEWYLSLEWNDNHYQNDFWNRPEYLHQLQNLYWCLSGKELNYKP